MSEDKKAIAAGEAVVDRTPMQMFSTMVYDAFVSPDWQRAVIQDKVTSLALRMESEDEIIAYSQPISCVLVKGKVKGTQVEKIQGDKASLLIIDGQHRYAAWKILKRPIVYTVLPHKVIDAEKVAIMNSHQKSWSVRDYVHSFAARGKPGYVWYKKMVEDYELNWSFMRIFYFGEISDYYKGIGECYLAHFKAGKFDPDDDFKRAARLFCIDIDDAQQSLIDTTAYKKSRQYHFVRALSVVRAHPKFNMAIMKTALKKYPRMFTSANRVEDTVSEMIAVYNHSKRHGRLEIIFSNETKSWIYR